MIVAFATLGCKVNHYETQAMEELFSRAGWQVADFADEADVYIINTCTVTGTSDTKSRQLIARAHRKNPGALVAAVGCYAQTAAEKVSALPGVGLVVGTQGRKDIVNLVEAALKERGIVRVQRLPEMRTFEALSATKDGRTRATLKIQDGCVNFCSYCIIPFARGPLRSRPMDSIREELTALAAGGYREVVLTGIHLNSYGMDSGEGDLIDVLRLADSIPGIDRVRLGSLEPKLVDEGFVKAAAELPSLCRQFHLSMQSGSDTVLARMRRRYNTADYRKSAEMIKTYLPGSALTTDVIAGFVGETEAEHQETLKFVEEMGFARIHVFPYSLRKGTAAEKLPGHLEKKVKEARARELIALGRSLEERFLEGLVGKELEVLAETDGSGYSREYARAKVTAPEGALVRFVPTGREGLTLIGEELEILP